MAGGRSPLRLSLPLIAGSPLLQTRLEWVGVGPHGLVYLELATHWLSHILFFIFGDAQASLGL